MKPTDTRQVFEIANRPDAERKLLLFAKKNPVAFYRAVAEIIWSKPKKKSIK